MGRFGLPYDIVGGLHFVVAVGLWLHGNKLFAILPIKLKLQLLTDMFMHIYKLYRTDDKYHLNMNHDGKTNCGVPFKAVKEDRICGTKGSLNFIDPKKDECCKICFKFLEF